MEENIKRAVIYARVSTGMQINGTSIEREKYQGSLIYNRNGHKGVLNVEDREKPRSEWVIVENGLPQIITAELGKAVDIAALQRCIGCRQRTDILQCIRSRAKLIHTVMRAM